ncbi:uncharacterized protein LOC129918511 [Episyrphus balteatus]|uniref:uncharacterized protein LOC129918511 n=1 Tax=Episyrphus balteatus TaxID=286459 RepID=UPI0024868EA5|nr:uncharacterized protein LOC129918511 [Episyrphus balteatus]
MNFPVISLVVFCAVFATAESKLNSKLLKFIENINKIEQFESVFHVKSSKEIDFDEELICDLINTIGIPVILGTENCLFYLKGEFNENILTIVQLDSSDLVLKQVSEYLHHLRFCKTIFVLKGSSKNDLELKRVFNFCWLNKMVNVVAVFQNFETSSTYYSYNNFGEHRIEEIVWNKYNSDIFPDRMQNLQGSLLPILFGGSEPGVIISKYPNGNIKIGGFVGHMFHAFAKKHNARLSASRVNTSISEIGMHKLALNGIAEISGTAMSVVRDPIEWFSYPYTVYDWGLMVPAEPRIPIYKVFAVVFHWEAFILIIVIFLLLSITLEIAAFISVSQTFVVRRDFVFNIDCFRGTLGQPFFQPSRVSFPAKISYSLTFLLGIIIVTSYDAFLQSFITHPPREHMIRSVNDFESSETKIYAFQSDINLLFNLRPHFMKRYSNLFMGETNFDTFNKVRNSFNTNYSYAISSIRWKVIENQQNFFGQQLFRWSEELCLMKNKLTAIPINENSMYKKILNFHILETQSSGLLKFWIRRAFYELMEVGKIEKLNFGFDSKLQPLKVEDFKWIWISMGLTWIVASFFFIGEICVFKWKTNRLFIK